MTADDNPVHGNGPLSRHISSHKSQICRPVDQILLHEAQNLQHLSLFAGDLRDHAGPGVQKADGLPIHACPRRQIPAPGHLQLSVADLFRQDLHRAVRKIDSENPVLPGQPRRIPLIDNRQLSHFLLHDLVGPAAGKEITFFHRIHQRVVAAEQNAASALIQSPVNITIHEEIHAAGVLDLHNPEIMGVIQPSRIIPVRKTIDSAQTILSEIIAPELSSLHKAHHILFFILPV